MYKHHIKVVNNVYIYYRELQDNLIRSHSAGVGEPLSPERTRTLLALRINVLAKGYSGISMETLTQYIEAFNCNVQFYLFFYTYLIKKYKRIHVFNFI